MLTGLTGFLPESTLTLYDNLEFLFRILLSAALGAAMSNAPDGVKQYADYVAKHTNNEDGVAEVLEKFVL